MFMTVGITLREESIVGIDEKMKWGGGGVEETWNKRWEP